MLLLQGRDQFGEPSAKISGSARRCDRPGPARSVGDSLAAREDLGGITRCERYNASDARAEEGVNMRGIRNSRQESGNSVH